MTVMEFINAHREDMEPCECVILPDGSVEEPQPSHIKKLEECGIVTVSSETSGHGNQKICSVHLDKATDQSVIIYIEIFEDLVFSQVIIYKGNNLQLTE